MGIIQELNQLLHEPSDFTIRTVALRGEPLEAYLVYLAGIADPKKIDNMLHYILRVDGTDEGWLQVASLGETFQPAAQLLKAQLLHGKCLLFHPSIDEAVAINVELDDHRAIEPSLTENALLGPRDAFIEHLQVNLSLLRRRLHSEDLVLREVTLGTKANETLCICYMDSLVNRTVLETVMNKLQALKVDTVSDTTQLVHLLYTEKWLAWSPFPLFQNTERPDRAVAAMMGGRIVMLLDNTATAVIVPVTMGVLFQTPDDYYLPTVSGSFLRLVRFMGLMITIFMPALYISLTSVNQDVLRVQIMLAIAASREGVPYPAYIEVLIMMLLVELINEATVRLPKSIGGTATIVGGLIIGTAAAQSHLISNIMIVITAATAIGSYTMANYILGLAWRICSYFIIMLSISFGLYGMTIGTAIVLLYLCHLKPWGIPYLAPFNTNNFRDLVRDSLFRLPKRMMIFRPSSYSNQAAHTQKLRIQSEEEL